jgi:hypothetical protein
MSSRAGDKIMMHIKKKCCKPATILVLDRLEDWFNRCRVRVDISIIGTSQAASIREICRKWTNGQDNIASEFSAISVIPGILAGLSESSLEESTMVGFPIHSYLDARLSSAQPANVRIQPINKPTSTQQTKEHRKARFKVEKANPKKNNPLRFDFASVCLSVKFESESASESSTN